MISYIIAFLVMLNPFAMFLYLSPIMHDLKKKTFYKVLFKASLISFGIFFVFLLTGNFLFESVFLIDFESFRIFGGVVIFTYAYLFIVKGQRAFVQLKEDLDDLASEIALPFMIGAGTISLTILMSFELDFSYGLLALLVILFINYFVIVGLMNFRDGLKKERLRIAFDKNVEVLLRLNGFFVGAIGVHMIITGINNLYVA